MQICAVFEPCLRSRRNTTGSQTQSQFTRDNQMLLQSFACDTAPAPAGIGQEGFVRYQRKMFLRGSGRATLRKG